MLPIDYFTTISHFARSTAETEGWTDETLLGILFDFLENQEDKVKANFARYLDERRWSEEKEVLEWMETDGFRENVMGALELIETVLREQMADGEPCTLMEAVLMVARGEA